MSEFVRSMLFVPASRWTMIEKGAASAADAVCLDLEDSVPDAEKPAARSNAARAFRELDFGSRIRILRVNPIDSPFAYRDVIDVVEGSGGRLDLLMLPKAASAAHVQFLDLLLTQIESALQFDHRIGIEAQIETAAGFVAIRDIAASSTRLDALIFGPGDYSASMRMPSADIGVPDEHDALYPGHRCHAVMHSIVAHAHAAGLRAMDGPYAAFKDAAGFERSCRVARALGFDGKQCIHPAQLDTANQVFAATAGEIERARQVLDAYQAAAATGRGSATFEGKMIDAANVRMARSILQRSARP